MKTREVLEYLFDELEEEEEETKEQLYEWQSEPNACKECAKHDGKFFTLDEAPIMPPNCKCDLVATINGKKVTVSVGELSKKKYEEQKAKSRKTGDVISINDINPLKTLKNDYGVDINVSTSGTGLADAYARYGNPVAQEPTSIGGNWFIKSAAAEPLQQNNAGQQQSIPQYCNFGGLSQYFESKFNPKAIGYDKVGGYSYGQYQLASKAGGLEDFFNFLKHKPEHKEYLKQLENAGGLIAARQKTPEFTQTWYKLAENPDFVQAQEDSLIKNNLNVTLNKIKDIPGLDVENRGPTVKDSIFSMAVQQGGSGAAKSIRQQLNGVDASQLSDEELITHFYRARSSDNGTFRHSSEETRRSVDARFQEELKKALECSRLLQN